MDHRVCRGNCPVRTPKELDARDFALLNPQLLAKKRIPEQTVPVTTPPQTVAKVDKDGEARVVEIYFKFGLAVPTPAGLKGLDALYSAISNHDMESPTEEVQILVAWETDNIGTQRFNNKLALRRANFVATWLKKRGIEAKVSVTGKGLCCRPRPYQVTDTALVKMRRVRAQVQPTP